MKSICQSKKLSELKTDGARLLYTWLIPNVDVNGCYSGDTQVIKGRIFTRLRRSAQAIEGYLEDLEECGLIVRYSANNDVYLNIPDFAQRQPNINPSREGKPNIPPPTPDLLKSKSGLSPLEVKEKQSKVKGRAKPFVPPTLQEIQSYISEKKYNVDAKKFFEWYTESEWKDRDGKPVKNWKLKVITWSTHNGSTKTAAGKQTRTGEVGRPSFAEQKSEIGTEIEV